MLGDAIEYPLRGEGATKRLAAGGGLYLASGVVGLVAGALSLVPVVGGVLGVGVGVLSLVPTLLVGGYSVAVSRAVLADQPAPPALDDWGRYLRDGLAAVGVAVLYAVPGGVLAVVAAGLALLADSLPTEVSGVVVGLLWVVGGLGGFAYVLAYAYALPAGLVNYARTDRFGGAWDLGPLRTVLFDREYAAGWVLAALLLAAGNAVGSSFVWFLVGFAVLFYAQVAGVRAVTDGFARALDGSPDPAVTPTRVPERSAAGADDVAGLGDATGGAADSSGEPATAAAGPDEAGGPTGDAAGSSGGATAAADQGAGGGDGEGALTALDGVDATTATALRRAGFTTAADVGAASRRELTAAEGVGPALADRVKRAAASERDDAER